MFRKLISALVFATILATHPITQRVAHAVEARWSPSLSGCDPADAPCLTNAQLLHERYGWHMVNRFSHSESTTLLEAAQHIETWFVQQGITDGATSMKAVLGEIYFAAPNVEGVVSGRANVAGATVFLTEAWTEQIVLHEVGHVLDNRTGANRLANTLGGSARWGGGASDALSAALGGTPEACTARFLCPTYTPPQEKPALYAEGPSEDFAETFRFVIFAPDYAADRYPQHAEWMHHFLMAESLMQTATPEVAAPVQPHRTAPYQPAK